MSDTEHLGPYELREELGRGAMARVWRAWDPNLEREVAIKEPLFDPRLSEEVLEEMGRRFVKEGRTAARLHHPGIVSIYAADVYDGRPAIVMELVEGATLSDLLEKGPLSPESSLDALDQLLDAVGYAHDKGVIHRDIKPDNIFVDQEGQVKLADFGIAHVDDASATKATIVGTVLGTPGYMSPEQATGASVDKRSDLFSIGVVGYEMLSGHNPFGADTATDSTTLLYRIVHEPAPELPEASSKGLPATLDAAIMAALEKDPDKRPQSASEFKAMLHGEALPQNKPSSELSDSVKKSTRSFSSWAPYVGVGAICIVVLAVVFAFFSFGGSGGGSGVAANASAPVSEAVYLASKDGKVAIYTNSSTEPYEVTDVSIENLPATDQSAINDHLGFSTVEEAQVKVQSLRESSAAIQKAAEEVQKAQQAAEEAQKAQKAAEQAQAEAEAEAQRARQENATSSSGSSIAGTYKGAYAYGSTTPFWGIFTTATKSADDIEQAVKYARELGFPAYVIYTTDWSERNPEPWYSVTMGIYSSEEEAAEHFDAVLNAGYGDAFIDYTGSYQGP